MFRLGQFNPQQKLLFHTQRINQWLDGEDVYPILIEFDLSNVCNHKCSFCNSAYMKDHSAILDHEVACKTIDDLGKCGIKAINWTGGGEPMLNRAFPSIAVCAKRNNIEQGLFTNGVKMYESWKPLIVAQMNWVRISLDAGTKETYLKIKGADDFDQAISIAKELVELKNRFAFITKADIGIGFVITPENYKEIPLFSGLIKQTGVDYGQYKPSTEDGMFDIRLWREEIKPLLETVFADNPKAVINLYKFNDIITSKLDQEYGKCYGHQFCPCIGADGEVWACSQKRGIEGFSFGNIHENSFQDIWASEKRQEVINRINLSDCPKLCKNNEINKALYHIRHPERSLHYNFL